MFESILLCIISILLVYYYVWKYIIVIIGAFIGSLSHVRAI